MARRKNRKINKKMSVNVQITTHLGAVIAFLFVMVILNLLATTSCQQLTKRIGEEEKELARLEDACNRAATHWEEMKTPAKVETALLRHGLSMKPPRTDQNVFVGPGGYVDPKQIAVAKRLRRANVAVADSPSSHRRKGR